MEVISVIEALQFSYRHSHWATISDYLSHKLYEELYNHVTADLDETAELLFRMFPKDSFPSEKDHMSMTYFYLTDLETYEKLENGLIEKCMELKSRRNSGSAFDVAIHNRLDSLIERSIHRKALLGIEEKLS